MVGHPGLRWYWRDWNPLTHWKEPAMESAADVYAELFCHPAGTRRQARLWVYLRELAGRV